MLEHYFDSATRIRQFRRGPLGAYIDELAAELHQRGYGRPTARDILSLAGKFSSFARAEGVKTAEQIDESLAERFLRVELPAEGTFHSATNAIRHVIGFLQRRGVVAARPVTASPDPHAEPIEGYDSHLQAVRGLHPSTRAAYVRGARRLLNWYAARRGQGRLQRLSGADVLAFLNEYLQPDAPHVTRLHLCGELRSFLRYLGGEGLVRAGLDRSVPTVPRWRHATIPKHLAWEQVRKLIDSVDTTYPLGMRDKAIILLLAMLGLRGVEIRLLERGHIAWRSGELTVPATKTRRQRVLPMPQEVGVALADYVLHGRPPVDVPEVFLRHKAPWGPFSSTTALTAIVRFRLQRAGITTPASGTHLLRHSLATRMVNVGVPIKSIADVLGHVSIDTTAIYTKVDLRNLPLAALPFPVGGAA